MADTEVTELEERIDDLLGSNPPKKTPAREFLEAQYDAGLAWVHFPEGFGGLGLSPRHQKVIMKKCSLPAHQVLTQETQSVTACAARPWWSGAARSKSGAISVRSSVVRKCGVSSSPNPDRDPTSLGFLLVPFATATNGS